MDKNTRRSRPNGSSYVKLRTVLTSALAILGIAALAIIGWQWRTTSNELDSVRSSAADSTHAEQVALDYAAGAAQMDFKDLGPWKTRLTQGTTPELSNRLTQAASSMEQIITPLQWVSTASPIAAKVRSESNGAYAVDCFVSVLTKSTQTPDGVQSTATYQLTIDSANGWAITEIRGIDSALGTEKGAK
ncbi:hypothetical protein FGL95_16740 [Nocardiaceae bacterium YC2-7]|uniref:Mce-associated membrane protein n=1 Tax=Antrihabitans stalactiti TaxID=2584121 RepID=A0A848KG04_9NOCA|nr:hypothetical protein [Antrihabitans stalactiti]